ncbi:hypothetical protein ENSA7_73130 [Enhygromyxa salina]|uniref:Uncharacterized protein n=1 Tax=Enhygromyxa salina TaxID=215803 RepID=A0A2S9XS43_9BACT|nr:hypothetical protein ENSA7_73130 [Enhygromyxa salina]
MTLRRRHKPDNIESPSLPQPRGPLVREDMCGPPSGGLTRDSPRYSLTYSNSAGWPSIPRAGGAIQLANFPGS